MEYVHAPYFVSTIRHDVTLRPLFARYLYGPVHAAFLRAVSLVRLVQNGSIHAYLAYVFVALMVTLAVIR